MRHPRQVPFRILAAVAAAAGLAGTAAAQDTPIRDLVVYGLQGDRTGGPPGTLFRWVPYEGTHVTIGDTSHAVNGAPLWDQESLALIPSGAFVGAYTSLNSSANPAYRQRLIKLSLFDATGLVNPVSMGAYIRGMTPFEDPVGSGNWKIYGARSQGGNGSLVIIDPATGGISTQTALPAVMEGLALDLSGKLFGVSHQGSDSTLWEISRVLNGGTLSEQLVPGADRMESLEFAIGDNVPAFSGLPAATDSWAPGAFANGTLMGFCDDLNSVYIVNPLTGEGVPLDTIEGRPVSVPWDDVEGLAFTTHLRDPMGEVYNAHD